MITVNLQRVVSIPGFIGCVHDAMLGHPVKHVRRAAQRQIGVLEKEIGFDIKVVKGRVKSSKLGPAEDAEMLHAQLVAVRAISDHLVVIFDEFQRLRHCPGDPLSVIRSALMSAGANHVSLLFTGSIRNALQMMLENSEQPIFGEAAQMQLPEISRVDFLEYLDFQFEATGKPADDDALNYLLSATRAHPRSTQQLAWECWVATPAGEPVTLDTVIRSHDRLVQTIERSEFAAVLNVLMNGDEAEFNEVRALAAARRSRRRQRHEPPRGDPLRLLEPLARGPGARPAAAPRARRSARRHLVHRRPAVRRVAAAGVAARRPARGARAGRRGIGPGALRAARRLTVPGTLVPIRT